MTGFKTGQDSSLFENLSQDLFPFSNTDRTVGTCMKILGEMI